MTMEAEDQEVAGMGENPTTDDAPADDTPGDGSPSTEGISGGDPLPVRQKTERKAVRKDAGSRMASPQDKVDPKFQAARARLDRQEQLVAERRRQREEQERKKKEEEERQAAEAANPPSGKPTSFSFNMTGERREPQQ